ELLDDKKNPVPLEAGWLIGQELENHGPMQELALRIYEGGLQQAETENQMEYSWSPVKRLVLLYQRMGRVEDARTLVLKFTKKNTSQGYDPEYEAYRQVQNLLSIANELLQLGYPVDALRHYNDALSDNARMISASRWNGEVMKQQAQQGQRKAMQALKP